jgi:hypothetical protein
MQAKLIKTDKGNYILVDSTKVVYDKGYLIGSSRESEVLKLSKQNCDEIFGVVDINSEVEAIVKTICPDDRGKDVIYGTGMAVGIQCFNKAMELNKDRVFTLEEVHKLLRLVHILPNFELEQFEDENNVLQIDTFISHHIKQPTEIEVEIELICPHPFDTYKCGMQYGCDGDGCNHPNQIPYLDIEKCLILTKKI